MSALCVIAVLQHWPQLPVRIAVIHWLVLVSVWRLASGSGLGCGEHAVRVPAQGRRCLESASGKQLIWRSGELCGLLIHRGCGWIIQRQLLAHALCVCVCPCKYVPEQACLPKQWRSLAEEGLTSRSDEGFTAHSVRHW